MGDHCSGTVAERKHAMRVLINDWITFIRGYLRKEYPKFILNEGITDEIPTFVNHHIAHKEFNCLLHLKRNHYKTLSADECEDRLESHTIKQDEIIITFDDGTSDVYDIVYPLLKQYGFKAIVFIIPHWIGARGMITWEQAVEMHESGAIDFQSHSYSHQAIFVSDQIIDYLSPHLKREKCWSRPAISAGCQTEDVANSYGSPIYEFKSRFSDHYKYIPDDQKQRLCIDYVAQHGRADFFKRRHWKKQLEGVVRRYRELGQDHGRYENDDERRMEIEAELLRSKQVLEQNLHNKHVRHFAFPWNEVGAETLRLLPTLGFRTAYIGMQQVAISDEETPGLKIIRRVTGDFIQCLPGKGRRSFWGVLMYKIGRRLFKGVTY